MRIKEEKKEEKVFVKEIKEETPCLVSVETFFSLKKVKRSEWESKKVFALKKNKENKATIEQWESILKDY